MTKTISLPETVYSDLVTISEELTLMAKKRISLSMAVHLLTAVYRAHMNNPCALDAFSQQLASLDILSPEEFDKEWDSVPTKKLDRKNGSKKTKKGEAKPKKKTA